MLLHADVDAFYASVAQRDDPALRGRPVLVGSWVVMAASYEARAYGIKGGMSTGRARRLCPDAMVVDTDWPAYKEASDAVFAILRRHCADVRPGSMEEAFLDAATAIAPAVTQDPPATAGPAPPAPRGGGAVQRAVAGDPAPGASRSRGAVRLAADLAGRIRREVRAECGLPLSVGVARTRVLAKMASRAAKPDGMLVVPEEREVEFLHPLPVEAVWGVGEATAGRLRSRGVQTVGQAAALTEAQLIAMLGRASGRSVYAIVRTHDHRPVARRGGRRSFGAQRALGRRPRPRGELDDSLGELAERVTRRMQRKGRAGRTVVLRLRFSDYTRATRSCTLAYDTSDPAAIAAAARGLLDTVMTVVERRGITLLGLTVTNLRPLAGPDQLPLFA